MRIAVLHNAVSGAEAPDEQDVLVQVAAVAEALGRLGHDARPIACTLDPRRCARGSLRTATRSSSTWWSRWTVPGG